MDTGAWPIRRRVGTDHERLSVTYDDTDTAGCTGGVDPSPPKPTSTVDAAISTAAARDRRPAAIPSSASTDSIGTTVRLYVELNNRRREGVVASDFRHINPGVSIRCSPRVWARHDEGAHPEREVSVNTAMNNATDSVWRRDLKKCHGRETNHIGHGVRKTMHADIGEWLKCQGSRDSTALLSRCSED
jgi:hypothetical protein